MSWISVKDELPKSNFCWYLICTEGMATMSFFEKHENGDVYWLCHNDAEDRDEWDNVTHWMPLPPPPKDES